MELNSWIDNAVQNIYDEHHEDQKGAVKDGCPHDHGIVAVVDACHKVLAHSWNRKNLLDDKASGQNIGNQCPQESNDWQYGIAQRVLEHDRGRRQAFGASRLDVFRRQHLKHVGAGQARDNRDRAESQGQRRQDHMLPCSPSSRGKQLPFYSQVFDQQGGQHEAGDRDPDHRNHHRDVVNQAIMPQRRYHAERDPGHYRKEDRDKPQLKGDGKPASDDFVDRIRAVGDGRAQIEFDQILQVKPVLHNQRLIQIVEGIQVGSYGVRQALAFLLKRIAGRCMHEEKGKRDDQPQRHDHGDKSAQDKR